MSWLGRYRKLLPLRARDSFHVSRADTDDGPAILVTVSPRAAREPAERALAAFADAHRKIDHPRVPRTRRAEAIDGTFVVELACDAVVDGEEFLRLVADSHTRYPYGVADSFITGVREAMQGAHRAGFCLGRLAYPNVLFSPGGQLNLIGFGHNVVVEKETGGLMGTAIFQAPEVDAGGAHTPDGDYVALLHMMRALAPHVDMAEAVGRVLRGEPTGADGELLELMRWYETAFFGSLPHERPSMERGIAVSARIRELLGIPLDHVRRERYFAALLEEVDTGTLLPERERTAGLLVHRDAEWFVAPDGIRHDIGPRKALRRVLQLLVERRLAAAGAPLTTWDLFAAGWPGEEPVYEAAMNRVYVTITRLRGLGLGDAIERFEDGYRLAPSLTVQRVPQ